MYHSFSVGFYSMQHSITTQKWKPQTSLSGRSWKGTAVCHFLLLLYKYFANYCASTFRPTYRPPLINIAFSSGGYLLAKQAQLPFLGSWETFYPRGSILSRELWPWARGKIRLHGPRHQLVLPTPIPPHPRLGWCHCLHCQWQST